MIIHPTRYAACLKSWQTTPPFANEIGRNGYPKVGNFRNSNNKLAYGRSVYANQAAVYPCLQAEIAELKREMKTNGGLENSDE